MTRQEVITLLSKLHKTGLANEPKDNKGLVESWSECFAADDSRVVYKACYIYIKIKHNKFFPTPQDIDALMTRARWLVELDNNKSNDVAGNIGSSVKLIEAREEKCLLHEGVCALYHDLCNGPENNKCPFEGI